MSYLILFYFLFPFIISVSLIPVIKYVAHKKQCYDLPGFRKVHDQPIAPLGGLAVFFSFWIIIFLLLPEVVFSDLSYLFIASILLFIIGLWDDLKKLSAGLRLGVQILVAAICFFGGSRLTGTYGLFAIAIDFPLWLSFSVTVLGIVTLINAFNLIDGINGLAGGLGFVASLVFSYLFWEAGIPDLSAIALISAGGILGFLKYNFGKASIFLGDNGSTFLGLLLSFLFLAYLQADTANNQHTNFLLTGFSLIAVPVLDLARVSIRRMWQGKSPFHSDQTHIHHLLLRDFQLHQPACLRIIALQGFLFCFTQLVLPFWRSEIVLIAIVLLYAFVIILLETSLVLTQIKSMEKSRSLVGAVYD